MITKTCSLDTIYTEISLFYDALKSENTWESLPPLAYGSSFILKVREAKKQVSVEERKIEKKELTRQRAEQKHKKTREVYFTCA
jgi:hypothetical protein